MAHAEPLAHAQAPVDAEHRFVLNDVPWWTYIALRDAFEGAGTRMTYVEGRLELMSPSATREEDARLIGRLLDVWSEVNDVDLRGYRSTTFRSEQQRRGLEPDECFVIGGPLVDVPQIAIEVVVGNPLVDKLDVYAGLGIAEVWVWRSATRQLVVHTLEAGAYRTRDRSVLLPTLDLVLLTSFVRPGESHLALVKAYRAALAG